MAAKVARPGCKIITFQRVQRRAAARIQVSIVAMESTNWVAVHCRSRGESASHCSNDPMGATQAGKGCVGTRLKLERRPAMGRCSQEGRPGVFGSLEQRLAAAGPGWRRSLLHAQGKGARQRGAVTALADALQGRVPTLGPQLKADVLKKKTTWGKNNRFGS
jgi:hypothetical protein